MIKNKTLSSKLKYFKDMFYNLIQLLKDKVFRIKNNGYKKFAKELYKCGALDNRSYEDIMDIIKSNNSKEIETIKKENFEH